MREPRSTSREWGGPRRRKRVSGGIHAQCGAHHRGPSRNLEILTSAEIKIQALNGMSPPGAPIQQLFGADPTEPEALAIQRPVEAACYHSSARQTDSQKVHKETCMHFSIVPQRLLWLGCVRGDHGLGVPETVSCPRCSCPSTPPSSWERAGHTEQPWAAGNPGNGGKKGGDQCAWTKVNRQGQEAQAMRGKGRRGHISPRTVEEEGLCKARRKVTDQLPLDSMHQNG